MARKRAHGEGTITKRGDGRWEGRLMSGYTTDGRPKRKTVYGTTQSEVREKLETIKRRLRAVRVGSRALIPVKELQRFLDGER